MKIKTFFASLLLLANPMAVADGLKIVGREPLIREHFTLGHGESRAFMPKSGKTSWGPINRDIRYGLRVKTFIRSSSYSGWSMLMRLAVNGREVTRYNDLKQKRLINHPDEILCRTKSYSKYQGEPWYSELHKAWNVAYGVRFAPKHVFCPNFDYDVTEFVFDIDDLVIMDQPLNIVIQNITTERRDMMRLVKEAHKNFSLVFGAVDVVQFVNPAERAANVIAIKPPTREDTAKLRQRIRAYEDFSLEKFKREQDNLNYSEKSFLTCKIHRQLDGAYQPGHIWLEYNSGSLKANSFIPMLDEAQKAGVRLVKVHAWWADIDGISPFRPANESAKKDFLRLIDICHQRKMKIIAYVSPSFTKITDDYQKTWEFSNPLARSKRRGRWGRVCTGSLEWRQYFFTHVQNLFDTYPVDGLYVDYGVYPPYELTCKAPQHHHAFQNPDYPYASGYDIMTRLYALCQKNNKLLHVFAESTPGLEQVCDAQIVGESTQSMSAHRMRHAGLKGNIYFLTMPLRYTYYSFREVYSSTMCFGHFPVLCHYQKMKAGDKEWFYYFLPLWQAMTSPGTHVYREISQTPLIQKIPTRTAVTAFVNTDIYLVLSNFDSRSKAFTFTRTVENMETGAAISQIEVPANDLAIIRMMDPGAN